MILYVAVAIPLFNIPSFVATALMVVVDETSRELEKMELSLVGVDPSVV